MTKAEQRRRDYEAAIKRRIELLVEEICELQVEQLALYHERQDRLLPPGCIARGASID